jgi:hypothetical protein
MWSPEFKSMRLRLRESWMRPMPTGEQPAKVWVSAFE